jgi:hypothetical protein
VQQLPETVNQQGALNPSHPRLIDRKQKPPGEDKRAQYNNRTERSGGTKRSQEKRKTHKIL